MDDRNKHIQNLINKVEPNHRHDVEAYIKIRREVDKVKPHTLACDMVAIYQLSRFLKNKSFKEATREDIREWSQWLLTQNLNKKRKRNHTATHETDMEETSRDFYLMKIKRFYKYISEPNNYENGRADQRDIKYPDSVRWITYNQHTDDELPLDNLLTDKQIKQLLNGCNDIREQTIIVSLLDGGLRKSELIALKIRNVQFDKQLGAYFILPKKQKNLKTGTRKVQLFLIQSSTNYIKEFLNHHPFKDDLDAPFIQTNDKKYRHKKMGLTDRGVNDIMDRIVKNSGLKIHLTPHMLRHNSATRCVAKGFSEPMLRERFGWKKNSTMPSKYVHLQQKDTDDKIRQILGIKTETTEEISILQPVICQNCSYENVPTNTVCGRCGMKLNITKKDMELSASSLGIILQKAQSSNPEIEKLLDPIIREAVNKALLEYDAKMKKQ
jgi:integrase